MKPKYYLLICSHCGNPQIKYTQDITKYILKCIYCNKQKQVYNKTKGFFNIIIKASSWDVEALKIMKKEITKKPKKWLFRPKILKGFKKIP